LKKVNVAIIGTKFMGKAHSNAWTSAPKFFSVGLTPVLKVACGQDEKGTSDFAKNWGWEESVSDWKKVVESIPLRFIFMGALFYLITCIQCAIHSTLSVQEYVHFTDWVVGHAHLVLFGVFSFWAFAFIYHFLPKITGNELFSKTLGEWHFWLSVVGMVLMDIDLIAAGLIQGSMWINLSPFIDSVIASKPYWWARTLVGCVLLVAEVCFFINVVMTYLKGRKLRQSVRSEVMA
jgi:cbb3-type cytochrome oxidase subunit 1